MYKNNNNNITKNYEKEREKDKDRDNEANGNVVAQFALNRVFCKNYSVQRTFNLIEILSDVHR